MVVPPTPDVEAPVEVPKEVAEAVTPLVEAAFAVDPLDAAFEATYAEEEEDDEEEVAVSKFEFEGRTYLRAPDDVLYDVETQEEVGIWNESEGRVQALPSGDWD